MDGAAAYDDFENVNLAHEPARRAQVQALAARLRAQFERALCGVAECAEELRRCVHAARAVGGEGMRVVLTVSPVRRWHKA